MRKIVFKKNWWLEWYWPHIDKIYDIEGHYGTRWSGKTSNIARKLIYHSFQPTQFNVVHCRKHYNKIEGSTFKILSDIINKDFPNDFVINKSHFYIANKHTGNWFRGLGMDDEENAKSIEGANIAWLNEANQFTLADYDYISTTIRGVIGVPISMIMDWNPQSIGHWLKPESDRFSKQPNCVLIKSTFWDNYLVDREALHTKLLNIKNRGKDGERLYDVWANGNWGIEDPDILFARDFDRKKHVKDNLQPEGNEFYLVFDLNYDPTCLIIQYNEFTRTIRVLREYHRKGQSLSLLLPIIEKDYPGMYTINGDASGHYSRNLTDNSTSYEIIKHTLNLSWNNFNVPKANPTHRRSRLLTNIVFSVMNVEIDSNCVELIADLESVEVDEKGSIDTYKKENPLRSHWLDPLRYYFHANHSEEIRDMIVHDNYN